MNVPTDLRDDQELTPEGSGKSVLLMSCNQILSKTHLWTLLRNNFGSCVQSVGWIGKL